MQAGSRQPSVRGASIGRLLTLVACAIACEHVLGFERGIPAREDTGGCDAGGSCNAGHRPDTGPDADPMDMGGKGGAPDDGSAPDDGPGPTGCESSDNCENPDPGQCEVRCMRETGGCVVEARDADRDGHASSRCAVQPGDDCDDARADVYPGAEELCDGIDNDCDARIDLDDGLRLSGTTELLGSGEGSTPKIAFSKERSVYGAAWLQESSGQSFIAFGTLGKSGNEPGASTTFHPEQGVQWMDLAAGDEKFGVLWCDGLFNVYLQLIGADGTAMDRILMSEETTFGARAVTLAHTETGGWAAFWTRAPGDAVGRRFSPEGVLGPVVPVGSEGQANEVTLARASDESILLVWENIDMEFFPVLLSSVLIGRNSVSTSGSVFVGGEAGFGVVGSQASMGVFTLVSNDLDRRGAAKCGPITIPEIAHDIAPSSDGYVIVSKGSLFSMHADCELRQTAALEVGFSRRIASAGADGFTMVWQDIDQTLRRRSFGPKLCD